MSPIKISWKNVWSKPLSAGLNILLIAFGTGILTIVLLASTQIGEKLDNNSKDIDLVVGAKGSPLQLVLSSIYYIDFPTGNIPLKEAVKLARSPFVKKAVPLALGDNYMGTRIVGTDSNFIGLYNLKLKEGRFWSGNFEATIGENVARQNQLKIGDKFHGAHGLSSSRDKHEEQPYTITGILKTQGNVTDNLILTNIASIWKMHGDEENEHEETDHDNKEITSLLIQYRSPMSVAIFPQMVNETTNMQAASPAQECTRLFSLIGVGVETLQWFALLLMFIAAISVFVNLYNSLKDRKYDLAIMRTLGASRTKLFLIVVSEGVMLTVVGTCIGLLLGHIAIHFIGYHQENSQARLNGMVLLSDEIYIFLAGIGIGIFAAALPSVQAYRSNISSILAKN